MRRASTSVIAFVFGALLMFLLLQSSNQAATATVTRTLTLDVTQTIGKGAVEQVCFSRVEQCDAYLISLIKRAEKSVHVAVYSFSRDGLARALVEAKNRGVEVKVVIERDNAFTQGSEYDFLRQSGVEVRLDGNAASMHHKFMIVDGEVVVTGSYNWSTAAEDRNDENIVILRDRMIAEAFSREFARLWEQGSQA